MKTLNLLLLVIFIFASCKKETSNNNPTSNPVSDPADKFVKTYTVTENMVQTYGGSKTNHETFTSNCIKIDSLTVKFSDSRTTVPLYSLGYVQNGFKIKVNNDKLSLGTIDGTRYGTDSLVITYLYGTSTAVYSVKWVCK